MCPIYRSYIGLVVLQVLLIQLHWFFLGCREYCTYISVSVFTHGHCSAIRLPFRVEALELVDVLIITNHING